MRFPTGVQTYSLAEVRSGTGWPRDAQFALLGSESADAATRDPDVNPGLVMEGLRQLARKADSLTAGRALHQPLSTQVAELRAFASEVAALAPVARRALEKR